MGNELIYLAKWRGEKAAGIMPGSEVITIRFKYGQPSDRETIDYWLEVIRDFYDGSQVDFVEERKFAKTSRPLQGESQKG